MPDQETLYETLKHIIDPEVGINIVDMGLIYNLDIEDNKVDVTMTLTSPGCPAGPQILGQIDSALKTLERAWGRSISRLCGPHPGALICSLRRRKTSLASSK
jgi:metal-sulfur cluster biosynthetic enzyme